MMKSLLWLNLILGCSAHAQFIPAASVQNLIPLKTCAHAVSQTIEGDPIREGWSSDDANSFLFLNCDDNYDQGQDHYVFTNNGVYYFFVKAHKDYKSGMEPTQFRMRLENNTYYFLSNCVGGMGDLFDQFGKNLSSSETDPSQMSIDPSPKNPVINFYMKAITGKGDAKAIIEATPLPLARYEKASACIKKRILDLSKSLPDIYESRKLSRRFDSATLDSYLARMITALGTPECYSDPEIGTSFEELLKRIR